MEVIAFLPIEVLQVAESFLNTLAIFATVASIEFVILHWRAQPRPHIRIPLAHLHAFQQRSVGDV